MPATLSSCGMTPYLILGASRFWPVSPSRTFSIHLWGNVISRRSKALPSAFTPACPPHRCEVSTPIRAIKTLKPRWGQLVVPIHSLGLGAGQTSTPSWRSRTGTWLSSGLPSASAPLICNPSPGLSSAVRSTDSTRRNICSRRNPAVVAPEWNDRCRQQS